ncbi:MAG: alpha/beta hydrolase [Bryobacterales bacterium]|nr:alpha/beta hydrolase [Bryobacterales bacterium]
MHSFANIALRSRRILVVALAAIAFFHAAQAAPRQPRLHRNQIPFAGTPAQPLVLDASYPITGDSVPAVIVVHGGGWEAGDRRTYVNPLLALLEDSGYAWFSIDHRLAPAHPYPAALEDVQAAIAWVHAHAGEFHIDPNRIVLAGESSGGHLVSLAGALDEARLSGVVSFYGIHNFENWLAVDGAVRKNAGQFLGVSRIDDFTLPRIRAASPVNHVHPAMPPYFLIHGEADGGVPLAQSEEMCRAMRKARATCELFVLPGAGHGMENWEREPALHVWKAQFLAWLNRLWGM